MDVEADGAHAQLVAAVTLNLRPRAVVVPAVKLNDEPLLPPDRVHENAGDPDASVPLTQLAENERLLIRTVFSQPGRSASTVAVSASYILRTSAS